MGGTFSNGRNGALRWIAALGVATMASLGAGQAMAGCGMPGGPAHTPQGWHAQHGGTPWHESIVGLWNVSWTADPATSTVPVPTDFDFGTVEWHPDGTEFNISGARAPSTGDVCMGAWKQVGVRTYKLHHVALAWASADSPTGPVVPAVFLGPATIGETITLGLDGNSYSGPFTIDQYAADGTTLLAHIAGTITGTRITAD